MLFANLDPSLVTLVHVLVGLLIGYGIYAVIVLAVIVGVFFFMVRRFLSMRHD